MSGFKAFIMVTSIILAGIVFIGSLMVLCTEGLDGFRTEKQKIKNELSKNYKENLKRNNGVAILFNGVAYKIKISELARISFEDFKMYYEINPVSWSLGKLSCLYSENDGFTGVVKKENYKGDKLYFLVYPFEDAYKLFCYKNELEELKKKTKEEIALNETIFNQKENQKTDVIALLKSVQKDINNLKKQAERELEEGKRVTEEIKERIVVNS